MNTELIRGLRNIKPQDQGCVVTIGNFDGVHKGHQALLRHLRTVAKERKAPSLVITFEPQPLEYLQPLNPTSRLSRFREKFSLLREVGVDKVLVVRFNEQFAKLTAQQFIEQLLINLLKINHIIVGEDFHFGFKRQGSLTLLKKAEDDGHFSVEIMPDIIDREERISSTLVRKTLMAGEQEKVQALLGRPYSMMGRVVYGEQRGQKLGFPTANISVQRSMTPISGVYVVRVFGINKHPLEGVANIGVRPTVDGTKTVLEVHLFNFDKNIYGKQVRVEFFKKIRDEKRFDNLDLLKKQIILDAQIARDFWHENSITK